MPVAECAVSVRGAWYMFVRVLRVCGGNNALLLFAFEADEELHHPAQSEGGKMS